MQYFYRAHCSPENVLETAGRFFGACGFKAEAAAPDRARYGGSLGVLELTVEIEGGHYTRVTVASDDVGESELDRHCKRFLAELHAAEDVSHVVRGAY